MTTLAGFMYPVLLYAQDVFAGNTPSQKVSPYGTLKYCLSNGQPDVVNASIDDGSGHVRQVDIKYRTRGVTGQSSTSDDCLVNVVPVYKDIIVPAVNFRKLSVYLGDPTIAKYDKSASNLTEIGNPAIAKIAKDMYDAIIQKANGLFYDINADIVAAQAANFGINASTGVNTAKAYNILKDATKNDLTAGMTDLLNDLDKNEMNPMDCTIVGNGLINAYFKQKKAMVNSTSTGLDPHDLDLPNYFYDPQTVGPWGANAFGVFEKNALQFVNVNVYDGFRAGEKGKDYFGTINLPMVDFMGDGQLQKFKLDYQLTYITCPTTVSGVTYQRGYVLTLFANYVTFNIPSDAYESNDPLTGNNGTLLGLLSNN